MESYESVQLLVTLQAGKKVWVKGSVLEAPLPPEIMSEIRANTGTVKVLKVKQEVVAATPPPSKEVVMKEVEVEETPEIEVEKPPEIDEKERARLRRHSR